MEKKDWQKKGKGHRQRLRDKFLEQGMDSLSDAEAIELLLTFGTPRSDCKEAARLALEKFGSLPGVLDAHPATLEKINGIGPKNVIALQFIQGIASRYLHQRIRKKNYMNSSKDVADYLIHAMRGLKHEVFMVVYLDASHAVIDSEILSKGTITVNTVYPRELIKRAIKYHAGALIIAHNHPSGSLQPSSQDIQLTKTLSLVCSFMHINLLDHLIIGDGDTAYSFADHGKMASIRNECTELRSQLG